MRRPSKSLAVIGLAVFLTTATAQARPSQDPGGDPGRDIKSRIAKVVRQIVKVVLGDEISVPHP
jgi:hypothetical protein